MTTINSVTDIRIWIDNANPDFEGFDAERLAEAIRSADHPEWGTDWSDWLAANIESLRAEVM